LNSLEDNLASQVSQVLTEKKGTFEALINAIDTKPLETEIETLGKSIATYTTEKATQQSLYEQYEKERKTAEAELAEVNKNYCPTCSQSLNNYIEELRNKLNGKMNTAIENRDKAKTALDTATQNHTNASNDLTNKKASLKTMTDELAKHKEDLAQVTGKLQQLGTREYKLTLYKANNPNVEHKYPEKPVLTAVKPVFAEESLYLIYKDIAKNLQDFDTAQEQILQLESLNEELLTIEKNEASNKLTISTNDTLLKDIIKTIGAKEESVRNNKELMESMKKHEFADSAIGLYGKLVNQWLPTYLYEQARKTVNSELAKFDPPNGLTIRLSESLHGTLVLIDTDEFGHIVERDVRHSASGLEATIAMILLGNAMRTINEFNKLNFLMIDEVSGPLHTGTEEDPTNWLEYFETLIQQIAPSNAILMIDQRLEHTIFDKVITLQKEPLTNLTVLAS
jgi:hypothetical protein